ncbi:ABC transmembrane type-1 domain-containing protein OS=Streptomyces microflavus OX=1919 GN=Smic_22550 PE=3 SV=1 [Streptomyces microflavus]
MIVGVILPNLRSSLARSSSPWRWCSASTPWPRCWASGPSAVWIVTVSGAEARMSVAVSLLSLLITWALLLVLSRAGTGSATTAVPAAAPTPVPGKE